MDKQNIDPAQQLVIDFKRQGHFDKLKNQILSNNIENDQNIQDLIKLKIIEIVNQMVSKDESLIFKNRGINSALIESKIIKDDYKLLQNNETENDSTKNIDLNKFINDSLNDSTLYDEILQILNSMD
ncbi:hypothetical protein TBLA_0D05120 [Henningerozyma blattae CBS 6284]|uniref:BOD1/SHG1 domain-containing protein n=1 Tax=Henningerozyma blattae (strain ATCC 34711 / CBS 6284 / DSM 70876 / NBRC 10599 / NRRL Y-10934 / UCD 77-7) TaxID=1071380 RepID=I2H3Q4_HENB6|nr:hypothetical protein TBLA_0D05120 [Tetrapisispora blattae CBS 6284]CCH61006.1 hypothetical protein TBLA_0D05120 [Tetrapisispora blattae CBS 6284]